MIPLVPGVRPVTESPSKDLFISHTAADRAFAQALDKAIKKLIESNKSAIEVQYSSSAELGPQGGVEWRKWINEVVVKARTAIFVVTSESMSKPWLLQSAIWFPARSKLYVHGDNASTHEHMNT